MGKFLCVKMGEVYSCKKMGLRRTLPLPRVPVSTTLPRDYLYLEISPIGPFAHKHTSTRHTVNTPCHPKGAHASRALTLLAALDR